jgi:hypothetical protein
LDIYIVLLQNTFPHVWLGSVCRGAFWKGAAILPDLSANPLQNGLRGCLLERCFAGKQSWHQSRYNVGREAGKLANNEGVTVIAKKKP